VFDERPFAPGVLSLWEPLLDVQCTAEYWKRQSAQSD
jgi:hypothetical protein